MIRVELRHVVRPELTARICFSGIAGSDFEIQYRAHEVPTETITVESWTGALEQVYHEGYWVVLTCLGWASKARVEREIEQLQRADEAFLAEVEAGLAEISEPTTATS